MNNYFKILFKLYLLSLFAAPFIQHAMAVQEKFELYQSTQGLAMGGALTADVVGYASNYYNPAGLATLTKKTKELNIVDLEGTLGLTGLSRAISAQSFGIYRLFGPLRNSPGDYTYFNFTGIPSFSMRGFSVSLIGVYEYAGISDGSNLDINARQDVGATVGFARNFAGNVMKLGVSAKTIIRNQLNGTYNHNLFTTLDEQGMKSLFKEGTGYGADAGMIVTIPSKWLPTFAVAWKDMFGTHFTKSNILNKEAQGKPESIPQTVNAAFSLHPIFNRGLKSILSFEYKHLLDSEMSWRKHVHVGFQLETDKSFYFWLGINQLYPTGGLGLRVKGGSLEIGTTASDIGVGAENKADRRFLFRYTIGF